MRQRRRRLHGDRHRTSPGTRMVAVSGHVKRPGRVRDRQRHHDVPRPARGDEFCEGIRDGNELKAFMPGGGVGAVVPARAARPAVRGQARRRRRLDARVGRDHGDGRDHRHPVGRADARCASTPTSPAASARRAARAARGWSASCSGSSTVTAARGPRPAARRRRVDLPRATSRTRRASGSASTPCRSPTR